MNSAKTVSVVVPSPATSLVLLAASFTSWAPIFSYGSCSSISSATVTPSLVTVGLPQPLSRTALRPRGPRVLRTARASLLTPANSFWRASSLSESCLAPIHLAPFDVLHGTGVRLECESSDPVNTPPTGPGSVGKSLRRYPHPKQAACRQPHSP